MILKITFMDDDKTSVFEVKKFSSSFGNGGYLYYEEPHHEENLGKRIKKSKISSVELFDAPIDSVINCADG